MCARAECARPRAAKLGERRKRLRGGPPGRRRDTPHTQSISTLQTITRHHTTRVLRLVGCELLAVVCLCIVLCAAIYVFIYARSAKHMQLQCTYVYAPLTGRGSFSQILSYTATVNRQPRTTRVHSAPSSAQYRARRVRRGSVDQARCLCPSAIPLRAVVYEPRPPCPTELPQPRAPLRGPARRVCALMAALHGLPPQSASAAFW